MIPLYLKVYYSEGRVCALSCIRKTYAHYSTNSSATTVTLIDRNRKRISEDEVRKWFGETGFQPTLKNIGAVSFFNFKDRVECALFMLAFGLESLTEDEFTSREYLGAR